MLVPNILLLFPNQEFLSSVGTFTSYNIGCVFFNQTFLHPERHLAGFRPPWSGRRLMFCAQRGVLRQMAWPWGTSGPLAAALANAGVGGSAAAHLMPFIL